MDYRFTSSFGLPSTIEERVARAGSAARLDGRQQITRVVCQPRTISVCQKGGRAMQTFAMAIIRARFLTCAVRKGKVIRSPFSFPAAASQAATRRFTHIFLSFWRAAASSAPRSIIASLPSFNGRAARPMSPLPWTGFRRTVPSFGGDPSRIVVIGQSAGAVHLSGALFDPRMKPACIEQIRAAALMSGLYDIHPGYRRICPDLFRRRRDRVRRPLARSLRRKFEPTRPRHAGGARSALFRAAGRNSHHRTNGERWEVSAFRMAARAQPSFTGARHGRAAGWSRPSDRWQSSRRFSRRSASHSSKGRAPHCKRGPSSSSTLRARRLPARPPPQRFARGSQSHASEPSVRQSAP